MKKTVTTVETVIDGTNYSFTGKLSKCGSILKLKKGMILTIKDGDKVINKEVEVKKRSEPVQNPFDMAKWFKASNQL